MVLRSGLSRQGSNCSAPVFAAAHAPSGSHAVGEAGSWEAHASGFAMAAASAASLDSMHMPPPLSQAAHLPSRLPSQQAATAAFAAVPRPTLLPQPATAPAGFANPFSAEARVQLPLRAHSQPASATAAAAAAHNPFAAAATLSFEEAPANGKASHLSAQQPPTASRIADVQVLVEDHKALHLPYVYTHAIGPRQILHLHPAVCMLTMIVPLLSGASAVLAEPARLPKLSGRNKPAAFEPAAVHLAATIDRHLRTPNGRYPLSTFQGSLHAPTSAMRLCRFHWLPGRVAADVSMQRMSAICAWFRPPNKAQRMASKAAAVVAVASPDTSGCPPVSSPDDLNQTWPQTLSQKTGCCDSS